VGRSAQRFRRLGASALIGLATLVRVYCSKLPRRGAVLGWAVLIQGTWWAWWMEGFYLTFDRDVMYEGRGRAPAGFALVTIIVLVCLVVGWLRAHGRRRLARSAATFSAVAILGLAVSWGRALRTSDETRGWAVPVSTTAGPYLSFYGRWSRTVIVGPGGELEIARQRYDLDQFQQWLRQLVRSASHPAGLILEVDGGGLLRRTHPHPAGHARPW
jgi:hypothetical protein